MKNSLVISLLLAFVIGSYFLLKNLQKELVADTPSNDKEILATAYDVSARYFNEKNQLQYSLIGSKVIEYSNNHGMFLAEPNLTVFDKDDVITWRGNADEAELSGDKEKLKLQKNVSIIESPRGEKPIFITGSVMYYNAKTRLITSDETVKIDDGIVEQISNGLKLDTVSRHLEAQNKVKAIYQTADAPQ